MRVKLSKVNIAPEFVILDDQGEIVATIPAGVRTVSGAEWKQHVSPELPVAVGVNEQGQPVSEHTLAETISQLQTSYRVKDGKLIPAEAAAAPSNREGRRAATKAKQRAKTTRNGSNSK